MVVAMTRYKEVNSCMALTPFSLNHKDDTLAGAFDKKGCPVAAIICPKTQTTNDLLMKHLMIIPMAVSTVPRTT
jgi:hypothetical protein